MLDKKLEIILITYNRKAHLEKTLKQLFAANSPIHQGISLTILDNCSTDGTSELVAQYIKKYSFVKHIRHAKNIGGNANIARIFELAEKTYVWPMCDDDELHLEYLDEVKAAIEAEADCIVVNKEYCQGVPSAGSLFRLLTFLPAAIYKTSLITPTVLMNIYNNVPNWFPHLAVAAAVLNQQGKVIVTKHDLVRRSGDECLYTFNHKKETAWAGKSLPSVNRFIQGLPPSAANQRLSFAYYASCELLSNPLLRAQAMAVFELKRGLWKTIYFEMRYNWKRIGGYTRHVSVVFTNLLWRQKLLFGLLFLCLLIQSPVFLVSYKLFKKRESVKLS